MLHAVPTLPKSSPSSRWHYYHFLIAQTQSWTVILKLSLLLIGSCLRPNLKIIFYYFSPCSVHSSHFDLLLLFLGHTKLVYSSGPLHMCFPVLFHIRQVFCPRVICSNPYFFRFLLKCPPSRTLA
jgi:hypothetical protein